MKLTTAAVKERFERVEAGINVAVTNEKLTRQRVGALEGLARRSLKGRLRWLLTGK